jgi:hypothetical protein
MCFTFVSSVINLINLKPLVLLYLLHFDSISSMVVDNFTLNPKTEGSSPAPGTEREKMARGERKMVNKLDYCTLT